ncbi:MAG: DUF1501 domain-containing protein [Planctomycetota bacterium]|nr:DUF1501 domain-containing protein [Planctomycetota bacterium]
MLSILSDGHAHNCERVSRRELLSIGTLGIGGLSLAGLLQSKSAAASGGPLVRDKAVVVLNLQGGPTHIETFDPKMTAPSEYRAMFGEVQTKLPGVTFGSHFQRLATWADRMSVVRSYRHGIGSHATAAMHVMAGGNSTGANMGSLFARVAGMTNPRTGIPSCTVLSPPSAGQQYKSLGAQTQRVTSVGTLPKAYAPFDPSAGSDIVKNMELKISESRLDDRKSLLSGLDQLQRRIDGSGVLDSASSFQQQAFDVILGGIGDAFDLTQEDPKTIERYDTRHLDIPKHLYKKKNKNLQRQSPMALGKQMLLARRLVQAGCGFITVTSAGWDMHGNAFGIDDGMPLLGTAVDVAASAFLEDLERLGLAEKVLLVITGEFGRTPRINKKAGRDHWGNLCTLAFAGGGLPMGQVIGASDRTASVPASTPVRSDQVLATIMHTLFDIGELRIRSGVPSDIARVLTESLPIPQLV